MSEGLAIIDTHPIQYRAPIYRALQQNCAIQVTVIYGSDFSVAGYRDAEFGVTFAWDGDLLSGYESIFLSRVTNGGARDMQEVSSRGMAQALRRTDPSCVLLAGYSPRFHGRAFWHSWRMGKSIFFRGDVTDHARNEGFFKTLTREGFLRLLYPRCANLLYVGQRSLEHYKRRGVTDHRLTFSPHCVDTTSFQLKEQDRAHFREKTRRALDIDGGKLVIMFSGKLVPIKAPVDLLAAIKTLPSDLRTRIVLLVVGDGPLREQLHDVANMAPHVNTRFVGFQIQKSLSPYFHAADILVLPSQYDTWGLVVNEALHHGVPCIVSTNVGCAPDLIQCGKTGDIFKAGSKDALAGAIERIAPLVGRPDVRQQCRHKVSPFTVSNAAEGIAHAYRATAKPHA